MTHQDGHSRCTGCGCPANDCAISDPDAEWTTDANGNHDGLCCEDCWHPNDDWKPTNPHPIGVTMSAITDELHSIVSALENEGHAVASRLREVWQHLTGDIPALEQEAVADGEQVLHDGETAVAPVVAEAEGDAKRLLDEAKTDVQNAVTPPATA